MFRVPEPHRVVTGRFATRRDRDGNNGAFVLASPIGGRMIMIIASDGSHWAEEGLEGQPWEHVSVHVEQGSHTLTPTWLEMCAVKDLFWEPEDCVIEFHPPKSCYVNTHTHTLHLWRPTQTEIPLPPLSTV